MCDIVNIVSLWSLDHPVKITLKNENYKKNYNAEVKRTKHGCFLLFQSGKFIATGFKSIEQTRDDVLTYFSKVPNFIKIVNLTAKSKLDFNIDFGKIVKNFPKNASYEPELFPALYWRIGNLCLMC